MIEGIEERQEELVDRFINTFNAIDHTLQERLAIEGFQSFSRSVREYAKKHPRWEDKDDLLVFAQLRNFVVHSTTPANCRLVVPVYDVIAKIETIYERLSMTAAEKFAGPVKKIRVDNSLKEVLSLIRDKSYSQFPVFQGKVYVGLLTENGVTRWVASHLNPELDYGSIAQATVGEVLKEEEERENCRFVGPATPLDDIVTVFGEQPELEAVLITESGNPSENLLGIVTPWDIIQLEI